MGQQAEALGTCRIPERARMLRPLVHTELIFELASQVSIAGDSKLLGQLRESVKRIFISTLRWSRRGHDRSEQ